MLGLHIIMDLKGLINPHLNLNTCKIEIAVLYDSVTESPHVSYQFVNIIVSSTWA